MLSKSLATKIIYLLLAAILLMGMGRLALLPPFEGYDETAHYSRLEAEAFAPPNTSTRFITTDVEDYYSRGPMSPRWMFARAFNDAYHDALKSSSAFDLAGHVKSKERKYSDYETFFASPEKVKEYTQIYRQQAAPDKFNASETLNWQFQHPPLYYVVCGKILRSLTGASLIARLFTLRAVSYLTAFAGFVIGIFATRRHLELRNHRNAQDITVFAAFYPFVMPVWFEEFARLGNDSLCALLFAINWALLLWFLRKPDEKFIWVLLGVVMGLSYLTKMLMLPASVGFLVFMLLQKPPKPGVTARLAPVATAGAIAFVIGYLSTMNGGFAGSIELQAWLHGKGYVTGVGIPWGGIFFNVMNMFTSMIYNFGDMAMWREGLPAIDGIFIALAVILFRWTAVQPRDLRREEWLPVYPLALMGGGLLLHAVLGAIAYRAGNVGVTPARYIHVEGPALMLIFGGGMATLLSRKYGRTFTGLLFAAAAAFNVFILIVRLDFFAGCNATQEGAARFGNQGACLNFHGLYDRLAVLGSPAFGLPCLALALLLLVAASIMAVRRASWEYDM